VVRPSRQQSHLDSHRRRPNALVDLGRGRANAILTAALETVDPTLVDDDYVYNNRQIGLRTSVTESQLRRAVHAVDAQLADLGGIRPFVTERALQQLKFAELLPPELARRTLEERLSEPAAAAAILGRPIATAS
jgi:hypothetical protein